MAGIFGYRVTDEDKAYLLILVYLFGIVFLWRGVWEASDRLPLIKNPWVSLFVGLLILTLTGYIFKEFDPLAQKMSRLTKSLHNIVGEIGRGASTELHYYDSLKKKHMQLKTHNIKRVENNFVVFEEDGKEHFLPIHRITKIHHKGKIVYQK